MDIAYHHRTRGLAGEGVHIRELVNGLERIGHDVEILSLTNKNPGTGGGGREKNIQLKETGLIPVKKFFPILYNIPGKIYLKKALSRENFDFVYERYSLYNWSGVKTAEDLNLPLVLEVNSPYAHETEEYETPLFHSFAKKMEVEIMMKADLVITISNTLKKYLTNLGVAEGKIKVIPNAVNLEKFDHTISGEPIRKKYGLEGENIVGFIGGLEPHHGLEKLIKAISEIGMEDISLLMVGEGSHRKNLERLSKKLGVNAVFTGRVTHEEIPKYIAAMNIAVKPDANFYCSPLKLFEYMGMKKPIISVKTPAISEIIEHGENGLMIEPTVYKLKTSIENIISDKKKAEEIGENALKYVRNNRTWEENARKTIRYVKDVAI